MAGPVDELKQAMRAFQPAGDLAQTVLRMISQAGALAAAGDRVGALIAREAELTKAISDAEAVYAAKMVELQERHDAQHEQNAKDEAAARAETDQIIARTRREATDFIKTTEDQRAVVRRALEAERASLAESRRVAAEESNRIASEREREAASHRLRVEERQAEIDRLDARVAELKKVDAEISQRLAAVNAARR